LATEGQSVSSEVASFICQKTIDSNNSFDKLIDVSPQSIFSPISIDINASSMTVVDPSQQNQGVSISGSTKNNSVYVNDLLGGRKTSKTTIQSTKDRKVVQVITDDGSGTVNAYDDFGNLINQATIQKTDGIEGTTGTVTLTTNGNQVTYDANFAFDEENGETIDIQGIHSINSQTPVSDSLIDSTLEELDLNLGDILLGQNTGTLNQLIAAGDPTDSDGWEAPPNTATDSNGEPSWYQTADAQRLGGSLMGVQSLIAALQSGSSLPIATATFNLASNLSRRVVIDPETGNPRVDESGNEILDGGDPTLSTISGGLNTISSILSFSDAIERGDTLAALSSGAGLTQTGLRLYQSVLNSQMRAIELLGESITEEVAQQSAELAAESAFVNSAIEGISEAIPYIGLINGIANGDALSIIGSVASIAGIPYVGWAIAAFEILSALFDDGPDIHGEAMFVSSRDGINVQPILTRDSDNGGSVALNAVQSLLETLQSTLPETEGLGLIAQRLPRLHFKGYESGGGAFTMYFSDPVTGQKISRGFDHTGSFMDANSPDFFKSLAQQFLEVAYEAGAIAPSWMVKTIDAQANRGEEVPIYTTVYDERGNEQQIQTGTEHIGPARDPYAGYTTLQRAAAQGQLLATDPGNAAVAGANAKQTARPIVLDLDGNGISVTTNAEGGSVLIDIDGDGFVENTDWINPRDGILVIDKDGNGTISGGTEMFNDSQVDMAKRGLHVLDELDANGDGKLTSDDFAFENLQIWQDINHDGQVQDLELSTLAQRNISEININNGNFVMGGQAIALKNVALQADSAGYITQLSGNSLLITKEAGESTLLASALADYGQSSNPEVVNAHTRSSADGLLSAVDELMDGLEDVPISVSVEQLLDNDGGVDGTTFSIISVSNPVGGTVEFDKNAGTIKFTPSLNFTGQASFEYIVQDSDGRQATGKTFVDVAPINDIPTITNKIFERPAQMGDVTQSTVSDGLYLTEISYELPDRAILGAPVKESSGIAPLWASTYADRAGVIGVKDGSLYWQDGARLAFNSFYVGSNVWQPIKIFEPLQGTIRAADIESSAADLTYKVISNVKFGTLDFNETTGAWSYTPPPEPLSYSAIEGVEQSAPIIPMRNDAFIVEVTDQDQGSSQIKIVLSESGQVSIGGGGSGTPIDPPESPTTPETPVTPESPITPETPTAPEAPTAPEPPITPETPTTPEAPTAPEPPIIPETPVIPEPPINPEYPISPEYPFALEPSIALASPIVPEPTGDTEIGDTSGVRNGGVREPISPDLARVELTPVDPLTGDGNDNSHILTGSNGHNTFQEGADFDSLVSGSRRGDLRSVGDHRPTLGTSTDLNHNLDPILVDGLSSGVFSRGQGLENPIDTPLNANRNHDGLANLHHLQVVTFNRSIDL
jgi:hypothetical protein